MIRDNLKESRNVFDEENEERAEWVEDMDDPPEDLFIRDKADAVYFTGCTASFFPVAQKIPIALAETFKAGDIDFTLMGKDEWCCGFPLLGAGLMDMFQEFVDHNIDAVKKRNAQQVVFSCPSCFQMWKEHYPYKAHGIKIVHSTQFLLEMIQNKSLSFSNVPLKVTYHDPCDLGRGAKVFNAPREVIRSIPGIEFVELPANHKNCICCGGGGNLEMVDAELSTNIAKQKIEEVLGTGAQAVVTACQQCVRTMTTYAKRNKVPIEVMDITQLVRRALKE
jgi:heterodisulfide reductase subunit D